MNERQLNNILPLNGDPLPFRLDDGETIRIGKGRITLDLIVEQYENGMTPEDMVRAYDSLALADVQAAIAYYRRYRHEVGIYLRQRREAATALQTLIEAKGPRVSREELLARSCRK